MVMLLELEKMQFIKVMKPEYQRFVYLLQSEKREKKKLNEHPPSVVIPSFLLGLVYAIVLLCTLQKHMEIPFCELISCHIRL